MTRRDHLMRRELHKIMLDTSEFGGSVNRAFDKAVANYFVSELYCRTHDLDKKEACIAYRDFSREHNIGIVEDVPKARDKLLKKYEKIPFRSKNQMFNKYIKEARIEMQKSFLGEATPERIERYPTPVQTGMFNSATSV